MRYIMFPIHSNWVCSIMNGNKKIEVRSGTRLYNAINRLIKEQGKAPCLIYVTRAKPYLRRYPFCLNENFYQLTDDSFNALNGKVVAKFEASAELIIFGRTMADDLGYFTGTLHDFELLKKSCLTKDDLHKYLKVESDGVSGTAIHIDNLVIFDKPKELKDFGVKCIPQSYCYCEVLE